MTQEEKDLVIQDLCARLPYGVKLDHLLDVVPSDLTAIDIYRETLYCLRKGREEWYKVEFVKPFLRPISSMTKEERHEYKVLSSEFGFTEFYKASATLVDWLNKKMFDLRGLIPKGLANVAPDGMYNS
jgi:hypothetical protein